MLVEPSMAFASKFLAEEMTAVAAHTEEGQSQRGNCRRETRREVVLEMDVLHRNGES